MATEYFELTGCIAGRKLKTLLCPAVLVLCLCAGCSGANSSSTDDKDSPFVLKASPAEEEIQLKLNPYGHNLIYPPDIDWRDFSYPAEDEEGLVLPFQDSEPSLTWLDHFDMMLIQEDASDIDGTSGRMTKREAKMALLRYVTEKVYPVKVSLKAVRVGRRKLLGNHLNRYIERLEVRGGGDGPGLIYSENF